MPVGRRSWPSFGKRNPASSISGFWGCSPILDNNDVTSPSAVDASVRSFWVDGILRQHAAVDGPSRFNAFLASQFGPQIPTLAWPSPPWSVERVRRALSCLREGAAPGHLGIPIAVWKALPDPWLATLARFFTLLEAAGS